MNRKLPYKRFYSLNVLISAPFMLTVTGTNFLLILRFAIRDKLPLPILIIMPLFFFALFSFFIWLLLYGLRIITFSKDGVNIALFGRFFVQKYLWEDIQDIFHGMPKQINKPITVVFSKLPNPTGKKLTREDIRLRVKNQISIISTKEEIEFLENLLNKTFRKV